MKDGEFEIEIRPDGSLKIETGSMQGAFHGQADEIMAMIKTLMGGNVETKRRKGTLKHHDHSHGHTHTHADGTTHSH